MHIIEMHYCGKNVGKGIQARSRENNVCALDRGD